MPKLPRPKHEAFALSLSQGKNKTASYVDAFKCDRVTAGSSAPRLMKHGVHGPLIAARVEELRAIRAKVEADEKAVREGTVKISRAWVLQKLQLVAETAIEAGQRAPATRALELLGKEMGLFATDRDGPGVSLDNLSLEDLLKLSADLRADPDLNEGNE